MRILEQAPWIARALTVNPDSGGFVIDQDMVKIVRHFGSRLVGGDWDDTELAEAVSDSSRYVISMMTPDCDVLHLASTLNELGAQKELGALLVPRYRDFDQLV